MSYYYYMIIYVYDNIFDNIYDIHDIMNISIWVHFHRFRSTVPWCRHTNIANVVVQLANEPLKEPQIIITTLTTSTAIITTTRSSTAPLPRPALLRFALQLPHCGRCPAHSAAHSWSHTTCCRVFSSSGRGLKGGGAGQPNKVEASRPPAYDWRFFSLCFSLFFWLWREESHHRDDDDDNDGAVAGAGTGTAFKASP